MEKFGVVMAGGGGTRFWPLSREKKPKQLLNLTGNDLMINETIDRMSYSIAKKNIMIITSAVQAPAMQEAVNGRLLPEHILAEPAARNTAACIGYTAMYILKKYGDGVMLITPADHYIRDVKRLTEVFSKGINEAESNDVLVTIGIKPQFPSTGYGYIRYNKNEPGDVKPVIEFKEKPNEELAKAYVESGEYAWNSGMFIWKASTILEKIRAFAPDIYAALEKIGDAMNTLDEQAVLEQVYPAIRSISVDFAVMEPSAAAGEVKVIPGDFDWNDVGSWDMMSVLHEADKDNNIVIGDGLVLKSSDCVVYSQSRTVTVMGVESLVIVETPDAVMVCGKSHAQDVKNIVTKLREQERKELL